MSSRFGRRKRRAAREAVERAEALMVNAHKIAAAAENETAQAERYLGEICLNLERILGPKTSMLPIELADVTAYKRPPYEVSILNKTSMSPMRGPTSFFSMHDTIQVAHLHALVMRVEEHPIDNRTLIRFVNENPDYGDWNARHYMCTAEQLDRHGFDESAVRYFVEHIVRELLTMQGRRG